MRHHVRTAPRRGLLLGLAIATLAGCERVVDITVPTSESRLVVEARLERVRGAVTGRQEIRLSSTQPFFARTPPDPVTGATVTVTDDASRTTTLRPGASPGAYVTDSLVIETGRRYTLRIRHAGDDYESVTTALATPPIDSLTFVAPRQNEGPQSGLRAAITFRDPAGVANWYLADQFVNGVRLLMPDTTFAERATFSDEFRDGRRLAGIRPYAARPVRSGDTVVVRLVSLPQEVFRWFDVVNLAIDADGSPFAAPPASARGNVRNVTRPAAVALGYFYATEVTEVGRRVP